MSGELVQGDARLIPSISSAAWQRQHFNMNIGCASKRQRPNAERLLTNQGFI